MEQEITMKELIALMNDKDGDFIIHVKFGEEAGADEGKAESTEERIRSFCFSGTHLGCTIRAKY